MSTLTEVERMLLRAAVDADETGEGYNDTSNLFATVEMIIAARLAASPAPQMRRVPGGMLGTMTDPYGHQRQCSCRPENGGSGVCGCVFGGPVIT